MLYVSSKVVLTYQVENGVEIAAFVEQGWRCIVPSQLGYHDTDKPNDPAEYTWRKLANDQDAILTALGVDGKVVVMGHDWSVVRMARVCGSTWC